MMDRTEKEGDTTSTIDTYTVPRGQSGPRTKRDSTGAGEVRSSWALKFKGVASARLQA